MQSITTKFIGPTNHRAARVKATTAAGHTLTVSYSYEDSHRSHAQAALQLARKLGWDGTLIEGGTKDGMVFVFDSGAKYTI